MATSTIRQIEGDLTTLDDSCIAIGSNELTTRSKVPYYKGWFTFGNIEMNTFNENLLGVFNEIDLTNDRNETTIDNGNITTLFADDVKNLTFKPTKIAVSPNYLMTIPKAEEETTTVASACFNTNFRLFNDTAIVEFGTIKEFVVDKNMLHREDSTDIPLWRYTTTTVDKHYEEFKDLLDFYYKYITEKTVSVWDGGFGYYNTTTSESLDVDADVLAQFREVYDSGDYQAKFDIPLLVSRELELYLSTVHLPGDSEVAIMLKKVSRFKVIYFSSEDYKVYYKEILNVTVSEDADDGEK